MNSSDNFTENAVNSGALSPLSSTQLFIRLINLSQPSDNEIALSNISLLISSSIEPETTSTTTKSNNNDRRFSYFSANPSDTRLFYCPDELDSWQQSILFNPAIKTDQDKKEQGDEGDKGDKGDEQKDENKEGDGDEKEEQKKKPEQGDKPKEQQQPRPNQLSKQQIENLLRAMQNAEKKVQDKIDAKKVKGAKIKNEKDW